MISDYNLYTEFCGHFKNMDNSSLAEAFNREVGNNGWTNTRALYLAALCRVLDERFDCLEIKVKNGFSFGKEIKFVGGRISVC